MRLTNNLHLNWKNGLNIVAGVCILGLTSIPLFVPADQLSWIRWKIALVCLTVTALIALLIQSLVQSREDHKQEERERERDKRQDSLDSKMADLLAQIGSQSPKPATEILTLKASSVKVQLPSIDGEV